jgi:hypothetical protein
MCQRGPFRCGEKAAPAAFSSLSFSLSLYALTSVGGNRSNLLRRRSIRKYPRPPRPH